MDAVVLMSLAAAALRATTPLLFAALGGLFSERSGVINIALEGIILFGAMAAAVTAQLLESNFSSGPAPWAPWAGVVAAMVAGGLVAGIHALVSIHYKADQIISGTAINLMAIGIPAVVLTGLYNNNSNSEPIRNRLPQWGDGIFEFSPLVYLAFLLVPVVWYVVFRTPFGLRLRSVGQHPAAADSLGVNVHRVRYIAVILSGVLGGLGGAYLSIGNLNQFVAGMSAGRGFIALAALIFGKWHPLGALGATLLFGTFEAIATRLGGGQILPPSLVESIPFILTMLVLAGFIGRAIPPKSLGNPY